MKFNKKFKTILALCLLTCLFLSPQTSYAAVHPTATTTRPNGTSAEYDGFEDFIPTTDFTITAGSSKYTPFLFYPNHPIYEPDYATLDINVHNWGSSTFKVTVDIYSFDSGAKVASFKISAAPGKYGYDSLWGFDANDRYYARIKNNSPFTITGDICLS